MNDEQNEEWYLNKAENEIKENKLDDAEMTLRQGQYILYSSDRITSLLSSVLERQASSKETPMADNTRNYRNDNLEMAERQETMLEKEKQMMRNVFIMRSKILSMQIKVAVDKIRSLESLEGISDTTNATERYRERAGQYFSQNNYEKADIYILEAEQLYSKMATKLLPAKPKTEEKPSEEYLRMKRNKTSSNHAGVTVRGNKEDVVACIDKAKKAFAANDLEKARNWLNKSQRILYTANALELLDKVQAAIAARDAPKEIPSVNPDAGPDDDDTNSDVDPNPEQARNRTPTEPPSGPAVHNENIEGAKTCIAKASKALKAGDFDKAENLLLKAKRMDASQDVEQYLKRVHDARARNTTSRENVVPEKGSRETERPKQADIMDEAKTYLQIAGNAFKDKKYERALIFLDKSEALHTSERAVTLRKQVQDAMSEPKKSFVENCTSYFTREKPSKPSRKEELDELISAIRNDIDAGNLKEAERKLQTPGFVKAVQLKKLRTEVEEKMALRKREEKPKTEESKPKPMEQVEPPRNEMLSDIRAEEANTCINVAEKAYYDGDLDKAERLFRKAERLYPTDRAKKALELVCTAIKEKQRLDNEKLRCNENARLVEHQEANTCIDVAEKAYYDGDLDKAEILLRKAERLYQTDKAKKALEIVCTAIKEKQRLDDEKLKCKENESASPPVEQAREAIFNNEVQKNINSGLDDMEKQNYYSAELAFKRAKHLQPSSKYIDELLTDVQTKIKKRNEITGTQTFSTPKSIEGISTGTQNRQNEKPTGDTDPIAAANKYTGWAQDAYDVGDIVNAEFFLKPAEVYNSTERSRNLLVMILRAKHGVDPNETDDDDVNTFVVVNHSRKKKSYEKLVKENGYLISAEDAFINGDFKEANNFMNKLEALRGPYVTELKEKIKKSLTRNSHWYDKLKIF